MNLNLNAISWPATLGLLKLDEGFLGSCDYMGIAYFWNYEYRHWLRGASISQRRRVHAKMLKEGLEVCGKSDAHLSIIQSIVKA
tara:strand:- start:9721 stop:9972 length:252 start_codon:yes stop_codon:yes gene_type:complete